MINKFITHLNDTMDSPEGYSYKSVDYREHHKIIKKYSSGYESIYAFVDKESGDIFRPVNWARSVKLPIANINNIESYKNSDWHGSWLF